MTKFLSILGWSFINLLGRSLRMREVNPPDRKKEKFIFAFWHGEQFIPGFRHRNEKVVIMSSLSRDGEIQTGILKFFKYIVVRGSSTRGAQRALVEMIRFVRLGYDAAFAVDGPKGPYKEVKPGAIYLAMKSGNRIVPVSCCARKFKVFDKAWDRYELPYPFSRAVAAYGKPIEVKKVDDEAAKTLELANSLSALSGFTHSQFWSKDIRQYLSAHPAPRIFIIQPSRIGDVVFTTPAVHAIRKKYPGAWIGWIVDERCAPVLEGNADVDEIIIFDRRKVSPGYVWRTMKYLRSKSIDLSIDFHGLAKSAFFSFIAGARFRLASSSTNGMRELSWLFSREIKPPSADTHCVDRHFAVADYLGCSPQDKYFAVASGSDDMINAEKILRQNGLLPGERFAAIHPGGGWISRRWFPERFSALIDRISNLAGLRVVLVGGREGGSKEKGLNEMVLSGVKAKVIDLTGLLTLGELKALIKMSSVFVGNEAGPMHIASAMGAPSVAILGPTNAGRTGPYGKNTAIIQHKVECQPCRKRDCTRMDCMKLVSVEEVFEAVKEQLNKGIPNFK